jgi:hypothetical protein
LRLLQQVAEREQGQPGAHREYDEHYGRHPENRNEGRERRRDQGRQRQSGLSSNSKPSFLLGRLPLFGMTNAMGDLLRSV